MPIPKRSVAPASDIAIPIDGRTSEVLDTKRPKRRVAVVSTSGLTETQMAGEKKPVRWGPDGPSQSAPGVSGGGDGRRRSCAVVTPRTLDGWQA